MTDNSAIMAAAKYTWDPFKFFAGYEYIWQNNPTNPLGVGASDQGGYIMSGVEDNNLDSEKFVQIWWTGVKYAYRQQNRHHFRPGIISGRTTSVFRRPARPQPVSAASCAGTLNEVSLYTDHHFTKRFDGFAGIAYSYVSGGLAIAIPHGPGVPYNSQQQLCSDSRWPFHLLIVSAAGSVESRPKKTCHPERSEGPVVAAGARCPIQACLWLEWGFSQAGGAPLLNLRSGPPLRWIARRDHSKFRALCEI